jgi:hypothetical protein
MREVTWGTWISHSCGVRKRPEGTETAQCVVSRATENQVPEDSTLR